MDPSLQMLLQTMLNKQDSLELKVDQGFADLNSFKWKIIGGSAAVSGIVTIFLAIYFH